MMRTAILLGAALFLAACGQRMIDQPREEAFEGSDAEGRAPESAIAQEDAEAAAALKRPVMSLGLLQRGRERFAIYCEPCHGAAGDGRGIIVERGMPAPPDYVEQRLRSADPAYFVDVINDGYGAMYSYADRVAPEDRWAIAGYIKALQLARAGETAK